MMQVVDVIEWPAASDVARHLDVSASYISRLIRTGRLRVVRTRLGNLIDPLSVEEYAKTRRPVRREGEAVSC